MSKEEVVKSLRAFLMENQSNLSDEDIDRIAKSKEFRDALQKVVRDFVNQQLIPLER